MCPMNPRLLRPLARFQAPPSDPYFSQVSLLLHFDGANESTATEDFSANDHAVTFSGNAKISTEQSKFGGSSAAFDGNQDQVSVPGHPSLEFAAGEFTVECWARLQVLPANNWSVFATYADADATPRWILYMDNRDSQSNPGLRFSIIDAAQSLALDFSQGDLTGWAAEQWHHVAVVRSGNTFRLFLDGNVVGELTQEYTIEEVGEQGQIVLGVEQEDAFGALNGYIDDLRITKGVARYTAAFTPPTEAFPNQ